ncbi:MAG: K(+)-transporting ATPase subunit F [Desulfovibrio sp.]|jgi:K+-transporting ATPase KdpF subunit|uniref:K(+)-transporting ATPase subunit F n=1 Tax=Nitratidesulfovibrio sp. TaxID=2802297 RepID=UPI0028473F3C|nr:K(+)-transporting ATPase subunit F [Desulfovibrio sp.]
MSGTRRTGSAFYRCHMQKRHPRTSTRALPGAPERTMELYDAIGIAFAAGLFVYLVYALFRPDKF